MLSLKWCLGILLAISIASTANADEDEDALLSPGQATYKVVTAFYYLPPDEEIALTSALYDCYGLSFDRQNGSDVANLLYSRYCTGFAGTGNE